MRLSTVRSVWLASLLVVAVSYTVMAFGMEWRTEAGRIGPGFFPRVIGVALVCALLVALAQSLRYRHAASENVEVSSGYLRTLSLIIGATVLFLVVFEFLGALLSAITYMLVLLATLNPRRWVMNIPIALGLPAGLYLLFQTWLNAGLPPGVLTLL